MLLRHLEYLVALAEEKHFARAAERCSISQSTLSAALRALEDEIGVAIVERGNRYVGFTREGDVALRWARRLLDDERALHQEVDAARGVLAGALRVGVIPSATAISPLLTATFVCDHPQVRILEREGTSSEILRAIAALECDAAITYIDNEPLAHVRTHSVYAESYVLVTPADHPLALVASVPWERLASIPLCLLETGMQNRRIIDGVFASLGVTATVAIETNSMMATLGYLRSGNVAGIVPRSYARWRDGEPRIHVAPLVEPYIEKTVGIVIADREPMPALLEAFWRHAQTVSSNLDVARNVLPESA